jgi:hypothetical protein
MDVFGIGDPPRCRLGLTDAAGLVLKVRDQTVQVEVNPAASG